MQKFLRRVNAHQSARFDKCDACAQKQRFARIVRDENNGFLETLLQIGKFLLQLAARERVERAERLVHQENRRIGGECSRHAHALALAARKLVRISMREVCYVESG